MSVVDDIAATEARTDITEAQRRSLVYALRTGALLPYLQEIDGQTITKGVYSITVTNPRAVDANEMAQADGEWLAVTLTVKAGNTTVFPTAQKTNPVMFRNPPVGDGSVAQLRAWARQIITDLVG